LDIYKKWCSVSYLEISSFFVASEWKPGFITLSFPLISFQFAQSFSPQILRKPPSFSMYM
jgi:hypothetical protein